ncbi:D-alanyl-D-alanine carboxypeptidase [Rubrivivax sp. A210]|uniref:D-alanyl-D-alanine carboxypeptidase/D-alanyl-D-alanine endopeptidase n=1 Tax=Rubrivivax sp. A210 TaxID=2772301 RepID=UPI00198CF97A|nr:D-alanyl-D-alanine carboxypeptidase/D-alanyl-D-alanine-endopeptidase [Rubrivivax sp. A210]CAD5374182.1 D-alanyl-D-alanine carboxypeptidase [Rubrivivax sp. A210]
MRMACATRTGSRPGPWAGGRARCAAALISLAALAPAARAATSLPPQVLAALQQAGVPAEAMSVAVVDTTHGRPLLAWQERRPLNPASLTKLLTTYAALDRLGPAWTWATPVWLAGPLKDGVLEGSLFIKGSGDPRLVLERLWLMLRRVQQLGVREIRGDIVLDGSAFALPEAAPGDFDGEPLRPYNVRPAALLFNFRSVLYGFVPDAAAGVARVAAEPALDGTQVNASVPLTAGPCDDWRAALKASFEPGRTRFAGSYPASCGEQTWAVADPQPASYDARLMATLWRGLGGVLHGVVREGPSPADARPSFELRSPPLAEIVRDINKQSNNLMAQQLFLTLAREAAPNEAATPDAARALLTRWLAQRTGGFGGGVSGQGDDLVIDNGSGLSRNTRISAQRLARLLLQAWDSPVMSELMSSLPISGLDGTLRRSRAAPGRAHLKTGSLRDVAGVAGYVLTPNGRRLVVVAVVNHAQANAARPALDALVQWTLRETPEFTR